MRTGQVVRIRSGISFSGARFEIPGSQAITNGADTQITFTQPATFDVDGYTNGSDHHFVIPSDGLYQITVIFDIAVTGPPGSFLTVYLGGSWTSSLDPGNVRVACNDGVHTETCLVTPPYPLTTGDTVEVWARYNTGLGGEPTAKVYGMFSIQRLGAMPA